RLGGERAVRRWAAATLVGAAVAGAAGRGGGKTSIRIGVLGVCRGTFAPYYDEVVAGAELPLLARGGKLAGATRRPESPARRSRDTASCSSWAAPTSPARGRSPRRAASSSASTCRCSWGSRRAPRRSPSATTRAPSLTSRS